VFFRSGEMALRVGGKKAKKKCTRGTGGAPPSPSLPTRAPPSAPPPRPESPGLHAACR
jgi:hypothetical protein